MAIPYDLTRPRVYGIETPFDELPISQRGTVERGVFVVAKTKQIEGWGKIGLPVPSMSARKARVLYHRGLIAFNGHIATQQSHIATQSEAPNILHPKVDERVVTHQRALDHGAKPSSQLSQLRPSSPSSQLSPSSKFPVKGKQ